VHAQFDELCPAKTIMTTNTLSLLVADGVGDPEDVDRCWMLVQGTPTGPFGMLDWIGINVGLDVAEQEYERSGSEEALRMAQFLRPYIDRGELGLKSGKGFYTYPDPAWQRPGFLTGEDD